LSPRTNPITFHSLTKRTGTAPPHQSQLLANPAQALPYPAPTSQLSPTYQYEQVLNTYHGQNSQQRQVKHCYGSAYQLTSERSQYPAYQQLPPPDATNRFQHQTRGRPDGLDPDYYMRKGAEAHQFFKKGRVFCLLWSEPAGETRQHQVEDDLFSVTSHPVTIGKHGEAIYQQIRRFVIVRVPRKKHFVYACPITTYGGRATAKQGCSPREHAIVYLSGKQPQTVRGEIPIRGEGGMTKDPIEIKPASTNESLDIASRLRFDKTYPVEWNVKVKDIGRVVPQDMPRLLQYWKDEYLNDADESDNEEPLSTLNQSTTPYTAPTNASYSVVNQSHVSASPATASRIANYVPTGSSYTLANADSSDRTPRTTRAHPVQNSFSNNLNSNSSAHSTPRGYSLPNTHSGVLLTSQTHYSPSSYPQDNTSHQPHGSR
jgi:hypothetical protein